MALLKVENLRTVIRTRAGLARPVDGVSFEVEAGQTLAIVGESGCGKSMTALSLLQLVPEPAGSIESGHVWFEGRDLLGLTWEEMRPFRGRDMGMIFQEPMTSLNPVMTVGQQIMESMTVHRTARGREAHKRAVESLERVGVREGAMRQYPHELSGGMRQRVMIAMALVNRPKFLIADEPTTALDVTVQAQILAIIKELQREMGMAVLLITHDLGVVADVADQVAVMYAGQIVESAPAKELFARPLHPYTRGLFASLPNRAHRGRDLATLEGRVPESTAWPKACRFADRCPFRWDDCVAHAPKYQPPQAPHPARCHLYDPQFNTHQPAIALQATNGHSPRTATVETPALTTAPAQNPAFSAAVQKQNPATPATIREQNPPLMTPLSATGDNAPVLLEVRDLVKAFPIRRGMLSRPDWNRAVDGVSFSIARGRTLALVGESGSGKSTVGLMLLDLLAPTGGEILLNGQSVSSRQRQDRFALRSQMQIVFQDPYASLNARMTVREMLLEALGVHNIGKNRAEREGRAGDLLEDVGLSRGALERYPHEFSGGQRQRVAIARALSVEPQFIVLDEPTSALDVSVQSQSLNLLRRLQRERGLTYLFITHNLGVVDYFADDVAVMQRGKIVERGATDAIFDRPQEEYTRTLLQAVPSLVTAV